MKSNIFREVLNEEYIEVNKSVSKTIQYLSEISGPVIESLPDDIGISFECSKKGKITVWSYDPTAPRRITRFRKSNDTLYPLYYVYGQVISKDNKTYIKMNSVYKKSEIYKQFLCTLLAFLIFPFFILYLLEVSRFNVPIVIISLIGGFFLSLNDYSSVAQRKSRGLTILPIMENTVKKYAKNIEKWED